MIETHGKLLISAFIVLIIGLVLIQVIGDDVELAKVGSRAILNESVSLTVVTVDITNESITMTNGTGTGVNLTGTLANNYLTVLTEIRNLSMQVIPGDCNVTLASGAVSCNFTGYPAVLYFDYTYNDSATGQLSATYDEWNSFDACRDSAMTAILIDTHCNLSLTSGAVTGNYDNFTNPLAYIDYKYEPDTYVHNSAARTILTVTVLLFAVGLVLVGIGYAWKSLKEADMF